MCVEKILIAGMRAQPSHVEFYTDLLFHSKVAELFSCAYAWPSIYTDNNYYSSFFLGGGGGCSLCLVFEKNEAKIVNCLIELKEKFCSN